MSVLLAIVFLVLIVPILLLVAIALGPAALGILFLIGCALFILSIDRAARQTRHMLHR